jgi:hypothetical protein
VSAESMGAAAIAIAALALFMGIMAHIRIDVLEKRAPRP